MRTRTDGAHLLFGEHDGLSLQLLMLVAPRLDPAEFLFSLDVPAGAERLPESVTLAPCGTSSLVAASYAVDPLDQYVLRFCDGSRFDASAAMHALAAEQETTSVSHDMSGSKFAETATAIATSVRAIIASSRDSAGIVVVERTRRSQVDRPFFPPIRVEAELSGSVVDPQFCGLLGNN